LTRIVINADDFGISPETNTAIVDAHLRGVLTSTSVMANMPGFADAVASKDKVPGLGFGAHLSLNVGRPLLGAAKVPLLCDNEGWLQGSFFYHLKASRDPGYLRQAEAELRAQMACLMDHGFVLDHVNSQSHTHMIPALHALALKLAKEHGIRQVRFSREKFAAQPPPRPANLGKWAILGALGRLCQRPDKQSGRFVGVLHTSAMDKHCLLTHLQRAKGAWLELMTHPGAGKLDNPGAYQGFVSAFLGHPDRVREWKALLDGQVMREVQRLGHPLATFGQIHGRPAGVLR